MKKILWITWEAQRRNKEIAQAIGAKFYQLDDIWKHKRITRYIIGIQKTFRIIRSERPDTLIVQNPSVVLTCFSILCKYFYKFRLGIDTHNAGFALENNSRIFRWCALFIQRTADFIIAHNDSLKNIISSRGGKVISLPDKIPYIDQCPPLSLEGKYNFFFICSYAKDEPYQEVINAFNNILNTDYHLYVSGNYSKVNINPDNYPQNIHFLGQVSWNEFDQMLWSADTIIDLTTREHCLLCGAYESIACHKPLLTSDTYALRNYFYKGTVYANNNSISIAKNARQIVDDYDRYKKEIVELKNEINENWKVRVIDLVRLL